MGRAPIGRAIRLLPTPSGILQTPRIDGEPSRCSCTDSGEVYATRSLMTTTPGSRARLWATHPRGESYHPLGQTTSADTSTPTASDATAPNPLWSHVAVTAPPMPSATDAPIPTT